MSMIVKYPLIDDKSSPLGLTASKLFRKHRLILSAALFFSGAGGVDGAFAANILSYAHAGSYNAVTYTFTAKNTGDVKAYFTGASAAYDSKIGLLVNGVSTGVFGLGNHTSKIGQSLDLGHVKAGDTLVFVLDILTLGGQKIYSAPPMNSGYDPLAGGGANHVFSSAYAGSDPAMAGVPAGTSVAFEDLTIPRSDFDYNDETFVFTNVSTDISAPGTPTHTTITPTTPTSGVPEPGAWALMLIGFAVVGAGARRARLANARAA